MQEWILLDHLEASRDCIRSEDDGRGGLTNPYRPSSQREVVDSSVSPFTSIYPEKSVFYDSFLSLFLRHFERLDVRRLSRAKFGRASLNQPPQTSAAATLTNRTSSSGRC